MVGQPLSKAVSSRHSSMISSFHTYKASSALLSCFPFYSNPLGNQCINVGLSPALSLRRDRHAHSLALTLSLAILLSFSSSSSASFQLHLRNLQPPLDVLQLALERFDIVNRHLHRACFAVVLLRRRSRQHVRGACHRTHAPRNTRTASTPPIGVPATAARRAIPSVQLRST